MTKTSNSTIAKNTFYLYLRMIVVMATSIYTSRVILDALGTTDYGLYNVVGGIVSILSFINGALSASTSRFLTYELGKGNIERLKQTFSASLNLHFVVALIVIIVAETAGLWFFYNKMVIPQERLDAAFWVYQISIITTIFTFTQVPYNASIISHEKMSIYACVGLYDAFSKLAISYAISLSPIDNLVFYALLLMLNTIVVQLFYRIYTHRYYEECRVRFVKDKALYKQLLSYSGWDLFGGVASIGQGQGINLLLNTFFGPIVNAARAVSVQIQGSTGQFVRNFLIAARPQVIKSFADGDYSHMYGITFKACKFSYLLMMAIVVPIIFEIDFILNIWLGDNVPDQTSVFTILVLLNALFETFHSCMLMPFHAIGKIKLGNLIGGTSMFATLPIAYVFLRIGAPAWSSFAVILVVNFVLNFFNFWLLNHYIKYNILEFVKSSVIPCLIISAIIFPLSWLITHVMEQGWLRILFFIPTIEIILLLCSYNIALSQTERQKVVSIIRKKYEQFKNR